MGIKHFTKLIKDYAPTCLYKKNIRYYNNKVLAIDTSLILYQYISAIRNSGKDLTDNNGDSISHIYAIIQKTITLLNDGIKPIYVFDGKPPDIKKYTLNSRKNNKKKAIENEMNANSKEDKIKYFKRSLIITKKQFNECKIILDIMGIPYVQADGEADCVCSELVQQKLAYGTLSEDADILTFGCNNLIKNMKKKNEIIEYNLNNILKELKINYIEFINLCILLGCDYLPTIRGVGYKTAYKLILKHRSIKEIIKNNNKLVIPDNYNYDEIINYYKNCNQNNNKFDIKFNDPDINKLTSILNKYNFDNIYINRIIIKIKKIYYIYT